MKPKEKQLLGQRIKYLRNRLGLTQDALAEDARISSKYLSNIERGRENPTVNTLLRLAQCLKVEPWEMFVLDIDIPDNRALRNKITDLLDEAESRGRLQLILKLLQAVVH